MEPDSSPIRSGWLDALESTAKANRHAWMLGSRPLYNPDGDVVANVQWTTAELRGHLNGNALYRLADDCFNSVLCRVEAEFADEPFDMSLHSYAAMASARTLSARSASRTAVTTRLMASSTSGSPVLPGPPALTRPSLPA